jgi:hypothetical protein
MENNPFTSVIKSIRDDNKSQIPVGYRIGIVESVTPLIVNVVGALHDKTSLLKNNLLESFVSGEQLLLMPIEDEQRYIILCKVVNV